MPSKHRYHQYPRPASLQSPHETRGKEPRKATPAPGQHTTQDQEINYVTPASTTAAPQPDGGKAVPVNTERKCVDKVVVKCENVTRTVLKEKVEEECKTTVETDQVINYYY